MTAPLSQRVRTQVLAELLTHAVDYAGLYPPAALSMRDAVREYESQRNGPHSWALGRFVVGVGQLDSFVAVRESLRSDAWPLSVLVPQPNDKVADQTRHATLLRVEAIETKAATAAEVAALEPLTTLSRELYVELPLGDQLDVLIAAVKALGARAKIRTGGVTPDAIPTAEAVARFIVACVRAGVRFKATAGLHHLIRGDYALTYEPESPRAAMFGYLNVFVATALAYRGAPLRTVLRVLEERDLATFAVSQRAGGELCWREHCLTVADARATHEHAIAGVGSCSFAEPIAELLASALADAR
ncbi:MAG: hypothetical protein ACT4P6_16185 [Gemmatimonadaceae bacterium]